MRIRLFLTENTGFAAASRPLRLQWLGIARARMVPKNKAACHFAFGRPPGSLLGLAEDAYRAPRSQLNICA